MIKKVAIIILLVLIYGVYHLFCWMSDYSHDDISSAAERKILLSTFQIYNQAGTVAVGQTAYAVGPHLLVTVAHGLSRENGGPYNLSWSIKNVNSSHTIPVKIVAADYHHDILLLHSNVYLSQTLLLGDDINTRIFLVDLFSDQSYFIAGHWNGWPNHYNGMNLSVMEKTGRSGNSGAPVVNHLGELVGMWWGEVDAKTLWQSKEQTYGVIIPISKIRQFVEEYQTRKSPRN